MVNGLFLQVAPLEGTILSNPLVANIILPFLLIFTVVFAILQKSKILGEGKKQIDAIVSLVIGLIVVSFGYATGVIISLIPVLAISVVVLLVFMLIYGMAFSHEEGFKLHKGVQGVIGALAAIVVVITLLVATGGWNYITDLVLYGGSGGSAVVTNIIFIVVVLVAILIVAWPFGGKGDKDK